MKAPRSTRLCVEVLENRLTPAATTNLTFSGPNLIGITSDAQTLTVQLVGLNMVDVIDESNVQGTFPTGSTVTVHEKQSINNFATGAQVTLDLNGNEFDANYIVNVDPENGGATVNIGGPTAAGDGTLVGNVTVTMGAPGSLAFNVVNVGVSADVNLQGSLGVNTGANGAIFGNEVNVGPGGGPIGTNITGNVVILNPVFTFISNTPIGGSVRIDTSTQLVPSLVSITGSPLAMTTIGQNLSITTTGLADFVSVDANTFINGSATFNLGNGATTGDTLSEAATVLGNLNVTAGSGPETVAVTNFVGNNLAISVGNGSDHISLTFLSVLGTSFKVNALNGNNVLTINNLYAPGARLQAFFGNGNNSVFFDANTTFAFGIDFEAGTGHNHVFLTGFYHYPVILRHFS